MIKLQTVILFLASFWVVFTFAGCGEPEPVLIDCEEHLSRSTTTAVIGRTEHGSLYKLGIVFVRYEHVVFGDEQVGDVITAPVKKFFSQRGYTPKVVVISDPDQIIHIGEDVDPAPMLKDLERVKGVESAALYPLHTLSDLVLSAFYLPELEDNGGFTLHDDLFRRLYGKEETTLRALIEVGKASDGSLYEFGSVLVKYHKGAKPLSDPTFLPYDGAPAQTVHDYFLSKGYAPKGEYLYEGLEIVRVGECVDTAPMLEELRALPGVADVQLNTFSLFETPIVDKLLDRG